MVVKTFSARCFFWDNFLKSKQGTLNVFGTKSNLKGSPLTSEATRCYFGQSDSNWIKGNVPGLKKSARTRSEKLHVNYLRAQVNCRQLRAKTAGNRYLRRFLPASEGVFTCGSVHLRPSQVILHAPVLQCIWQL